MIKRIKNKIIEDNFFRPSWYSIFINPYFINRHSLFKEIKKFSKEINTGTSILDVGCGIKPYRKIFQTEKYTGIDIETGGHSNEAKFVDQYYDGENIPFDNNSFDYLICTQVLEHAEEPEKVFKECARVLKPNGKMFISMPFTYPEHEIPFDFQRFTQYKYIKLAKENTLVIENIIKTTGFFGTFGQLLTIFLFEGITFKSTILKTILSLIFFMPIQAISLLLDFICNKKGQTMDYVIILKK
ncbi:MAG: hypothetical protein RLY43_302 [Bacteroidota bacterium]